MDKISSFTGLYWNPGEAITKERMDRLEQGIESAFSLLGGKAARGNLSVFDGSLSDLFTQLNNDVLRANLNAQDAKDAVDNAQQATANGNRAWLALEDAGVIYNYSNGSYTKTLGTLLSEKATNDALGEANERIEEILTAIGDANSGIVKNINTNKTNIELIQEIINGAKDSDVPNDTLAARFGRIETDVETLGTAVNTLTTGGKGKYNTLAERLNAIDGSANKDTYRTLPAVDQEIKDARGTHVVDGESVAYDDLDSRLDADETLIDANKTNIGTLGTEVGNTHSVTSTDPNTNLVTNVTVNLQLRFANIDENTVPQRTLPNVISEIETAHRVRIDSLTNEPIPDTLNGRFTDDEASIQDLKNKLGTGFTNASTVASRMGAVEGEINTTHRTGLVDPETSLAINDTLDIRLNDIDEHTRPTRTLPNVITEIDNAHYTRVENNQNVVYDLDMRFDAIDNGAKPTRTLPDIITEVNGAHTSTVIQEDDGEGNLVDTTYTTLNDRFETIEATAKALDETLDTRINAIDEGTTPSRTLPNLISEVETAHVSSVVTDELTIEENGETSTVLIPHNYGSLDARFEAIETNIDTIATDLNMYNSLTHEIENTNTRVDMIELNVVAMANEIGMFQNGAAVLDMNTVITALGTRIDNIEDEIGDAHRTGLLDENKDPIEDTLVHRFEDIESDIGDIQDTLGVGFDTTTNTVAATIAAAISTAEGDATSKANAAEQNAKDYADNNKVDKTAVYNNVDAVDAGLVLDARIGKEINDKFGANFDATNTVRAAITSLDERLGQIDGGTALSENETLASRVTTLELQPKSATTIIEADCIIYDASGNPVAIYEDNTKQTALTPSQDVDYLLGKTEGEGQNLITKYYYWKYKGSAPNGTWYLISGDSDVELPDNIATNANVKTITTITDIPIDNPENDADIANILWPIKDENNNFSGGLSIKGTGHGETNLFNDFVAVRNARVLVEYENNSPNEVKSQTLEILDTNGNLMSYPIVGGSGGSDNDRYYIYTHAVSPAIQRLSYKEVQQLEKNEVGSGLSLKFGYTCYKKNGDLTELLNTPAKIKLYKGGLDGELIGTEKSVTPQAVADYNNRLEQSDLIFKDVFKYCEKNVPTMFTLVATATYQVYETRNDTEVLVNKTITSQSAITVTLNELTLESTFSDLTPYSINTAISIPYTFTGIKDIPMELTILLDDLPINKANVAITTNTISIRTANWDIQDLGKHTLKITASLIVDNNPIYSNSLMYELGLINNTNNDKLMLFSGSSLSPLEITQYQLLRLPYSLYVPNNGSQELSFKVKRVTYNNNGEISGSTDINELTKINETKSSGNYTFPLRIYNVLEQIEHYIVIISCVGTEEKIEFKITVSRAEDLINIKEGESLVFNFNPAQTQYSNNAPTEELRLWLQTNGNITYKMKVPDGTHFDWTTGGWKTIILDGEEIPCFCVKAGSKIEFIQEENGVETPLTLFWHDMEVAGSDFKCVFKIDNVKSPNAKFLTSLDSTTHNITQYGNWVNEKYQDLDDKTTLFSSYLNVKANYTYYYNTDADYIGNINPLTDDGENATDSKLGTTVLASEDSNLVATIRANDETAAKKKNQKTIKEYIHNIYATIIQINPEAAYQGRSYLTFLLNLLQGEVEVDVNNENLNTLEKAITSNLMTLDEGNPVIAKEIYKTLMGTAENESADDIALMTAYRQYDAAGFNAITNGFVVEGKEKKDGIIAKLLFYIKTITKSFAPMGNAAVQIISEEPISTNPQAKTNIYRVTMGIPDANEELQEVKIYEVNIADVYDDNDNLLWTKITGVRDATRTTSHQYGLELNASGSYLYMTTGTLSYAHSEGDIIDFEYNINGPLEDHVDSSVIIYEDGVPSAANIYTRGKGVFEQYNSNNNISTALPLTIGSDECDVYIYKMHLYNTALTNNEILLNFCAEGLSFEDMSDRYNRNKELMKVNEITPELVAEVCPDLRIIMIEAPNLTGGKNSFIKHTKIRLIYKNGRPEDNWIALNAYHAGQGTSSDNYGAAGRNLDIMFGFDGEDVVIVPKPLKNNYQFSPEYKSILITGIDRDNLDDTILSKEDLVTLINEHKQAGDLNITVEDLDNPQSHPLDNSPDYTVSQGENKQLKIYTGGRGKVSIKDTSIPNNWFNIKLNIASSENVNNAYLLKRFNDYLPYLTPANRRDSRIKNDMEFVNCVVFIKENDNPTEFKKPGEKNQWHFYGIGNIGDSKKTDSTRVNIPGDPYEFAIELSDNGLKNSEFSTGIYYTPLGEGESYTEHANALTPTTSYVCKAADYTYDSNTKVYTLNIENVNSNTLYLIAESQGKYTLYRRFMYINSDYIEIGRPISFENLEVGVRYPVSLAEWKCELNTYQKLLNNKNRAKGWDKSFEFRYDLTTKDGETIDGTVEESALNSARQEINKKKFIELYEWIVLSSNDDFRNHLKDWFIEEAPLYWYLFTERYTMIDSRAKNTFYHYGKIYITADERDGVGIGTPSDEADNSDGATLYAKYNWLTANDGSYTDIQNAFAAIQTAEFIRDNASTFVAPGETNKGYYEGAELINNGYRFELWDYDNDTALGINNNGQMVFSAGLEDIDKTEAGGWVYNAAESVIWCRIRDNMYDKLSKLYRNRSATNCFKDESLIEEFDNLLAQFPEELWRRDFERKYFRPYKDSGETTYLNSMANGRKRYQRRQFERNMAIYISSKYLTNASYIASDQISFRPDVGQINYNDAVITVKPYSTMYINFMIGNAENDITNDPEAQSEHVRVKAGQSYPIYAKKFVDIFLNYQCVIYNACRIMSIEGIDKFKCMWFTFNNAKKLSVLKLGGSTVNDRVKKIGDLGLDGEIPLLEELDISNIQFATPPAELVLDNFPLLKRFNAEGSNIKHFTFKDGGMLEIIQYFPSDMDKISFNNLYKLSTVEFLENANFSSLTEYTSVNSYSDSYSIVNNMLHSANITKLMLNDINWTIGDLVDLLPLVNLLRELNNNMSLAGTITITGQWSSVKLADYKEIFGINNITWITTSAAIPEYKLSFYLSTEDYNNGNEYYIEYRSPADQQVEVALGSDPVYSGNCPTPTKTSTISHTYYFGTDIQNYYPWSGWQILNSSQVLSSTTTIQGNIALIAIFGEATRSYPLCWYLHEEDEQNGVEPVKNINILYGDSYEDGIAPTVFDLKKTGKVTASLTPLADGINCTYDIFKGWAKNPINLDSSFFNLAKDKFCIYGTWEHGTEAINDIKNQELLDAKKLLVLTNSSLANSILPVNSTITINMGHDNDTGTILVGAGSTLRLGEQRVIYDGSSELQPILSFTSYNNALYPTVGYTNVTPLSDMTSRGFTLAIDYQINVDYISSLWNTGGYVILGGCYSTVSTVKQGFALYYDIAEQVTKVCFGNLDEIDTYTQLCCPVSSIAGTESRNIIVIRHRANTDELDVYSGVSPNSGMVLSLNLNMLLTLTWSKNTTDAPLCFGHFTSTTWNKLGQVHYGAGTSIHWAKYWDSDLGHNECVHLASWPHEIITFALEDYSNDGDQDIINTNSKNIIFSALSLSLYGGPYYTTYSTSTNGSTVRWGTTLDNNSNSTYKKIANLRFFLGLPIELLSIINITYNTAIVTRLNKPSVGNAYYSINTTDTSTDLVFLPSYAEVGGNTSGSYYSGYLDEANAPMPWYKAANTSVVSYNNGSFDFDNETLNLNYMNLRFLGVPINIGAGENRVYVGYNGATPVYNKIINNNNNTIKTGDIFIRTYTDEYQNTISEAYIYADGLAKALGAPTILAANNSLFYCASGGWVKSGSWWTRSPSSFPTTEQVKANSQPIYYVDKATGTVTPQGVPDNVGGYFVYEFGI